MRNLLFPSCYDLLPVCAVDPLIGYLQFPVQDVLIGLREGRVGIAAPEALPDVVHRPLDFPLHPRAVRRADAWRESVMACKVEELYVESRLAFIPADHDVLHVVVEHFRRNTAQMSEGADMAVHEGLQSTVLDELDVHGSGKAKEHDKDIDSARLALGIGDLEVAPVNLGLQAGLRLKPSISYLALLLLDGSNITSERPIAAGVAKLPDPLQDPGGLVIVLIQKALDNRVKRL